MTELVHSFFHGARPEPSGIGVEPQAVKRNHRRPARGFGHAEDKIQTVCVQISIGNREHRSIPAGGARLFQECIGPVLLPARIVSIRENRDFRPKLRMHAQRGEVAYEMREVA
jgi:hypothetical protein